ncbi:hypothetical protein DMH17_05250 [Raoultella planticola]|nr:hypothetical protein [Raoultella planticola]
MLTGLLTSAAPSPGQGCTHRPGTCSPLALRLPGLLTSAVPSPGQGFTPPPGNVLPAGAALTGATDQCRTVARARVYPTAGNLPLALRLPGLLTSAVSSPGQGVCPAARELPTGAALTGATDQCRIVARARVYPPPETSRWRCAYRGY